MDNLFEAIARRTASPQASRRGFMRLIGKASLVAGAAVVVASSLPHVASADDLGDEEGADEGADEGAGAARDTCCNMTRAAACRDGCRTRACQQQCLRDWCWRC